MIYVINVARYFVYLSYGENHVNYLFEIVETIVSGTELEVCLGRQSAFMNNFKAW